MMMKNRIAVAMVGTIGHRLLNCQTLEAMQLIEVIKEQEKTLVIHRSPHKEFPNQNKRYGKGDRRKNKKNFNQQFRR